MRQAHGGRFNVIVVEKGKKDNSSQLTEHEPFVRNSKAI